MLAACAPWSISARSYEIFTNPSRIDFKTLKAASYIGSLIVGPWLCRSAHLSQRSGDCKMTVMSIWKAAAPARSARADMCPGKRVQAGRVLRNAWRSGITVLAATVLLSGCGGSNPATAGSGPPGAPGGGGPPGRRRAARIRQWPGRSRLRHPHVGIADTGPDADRPGDACRDLGRTPSGRRPHQEAAVRGGRPGPGGPTPL